MRRLLQLLQSRIIHHDDILYFTFKKHMFTGCVAQGGLLWRCTWQKPGEEAVPIFQNHSSIHQQPYVRTFESLTDWTETCIQECLDEYHTRYSSWKRVRHRRSDQTMEALFKHLQRQNLEKKQKDADAPQQVLLYEQIASQKHHIVSLKSALEKWTSWYTQNFPEKALPISPVDAPAIQKTEPSGPQAQPFVLTSDKGKYMVLHRINEVAPPECVSWLKQNGAESFQNILESVNKTVYFESAKDGADTWPDADADTCRRFVHGFFAR